MTPSATATATPAPPPAPAIGFIGNTNGRGVYLRATPVLSDRLVAWPENTPLVLLGPEVDGDGEHWLQVRDPAGNVGWMPSRFVVR